MTGTFDTGASSGRFVLYYIRESQQVRWYHGLPSGGLSLVGGLGYLRGRVWGVGSALNLVVSMK